MGPVYKLTRIWFKPLVSSLFALFLIGGNFSLLAPVAVNRRDTGSR